MVIRRLFSVIQGRPEKLAIYPDNDELPDVGWTAEGEQVFLTKPFVAATNDAPGCEYNALYAFDSDGTLLRHTIVSLGSRATLNIEAARRSYSELLESVSPLKRTQIKVRPFSILHEDVEFGLIPQKDDGQWWVNVMPGNYIAFVPPWGSGNYDT